MKQNVSSPVFLLRHIKMPHIICSLVAMQQGKLHMYINGHELEDSEYDNDDQSNRLILKLL